MANAEGAWYGEWEHLGLGQVAWCSHTSIQEAWARVHGPRAAWLPLHQLSLHRGLGATFKLFLLPTNLDSRAGKGIEGMLGALTCPSSPGWSLQLGHTLLPVSLIHVTEASYLGMAWEADWMAWGRGD